MGKYFIQLSAPLHFALKGHSATFSLHLQHQNSTFLWLRLFIIVQNVCTAVFYNIALLASYFLKSQCSSSNFSDCQHIQRIRLVPEPHWLRIVGRCFLHGWCSERVTMQHRTITSMDYDLLNSCFLHRLLSKKCQRESRRGGGRECRRKCFVLSNSPTCTSSKLHLEIAKSKVKTNYIFQYI